MSKKLMILTVVALVTGLVALGGGQAIASHPSGPAAYWPFDDGANPTADAAHGNNGAVNGPDFDCVDFAPVPGNSCSLVFDGNAGALGTFTDDDVVSVPNASELNPTTDISVCAWVKPLGVQETFARIVLKGGDSPNDVQYLLNYDTTGTLARFRTDTGAGFGEVIGITPITDPTRWYHLVGTYESSSGLLMIHVDGALEGSVLHPAGGPIRGVSGAVPDLGFGRDANNPTIHAFDGNLDEVKIFNRTLSDEEIGSLCVTESPFGAFEVSKAKIEFGPLGGDDRVKVEGDFTLGEDSNRFDLSVEEVVVTVGTSSITIPAGLFMPVGSRFEFEGTIDGAKVKMKIKETHSDVFKFKVKVKGFSVTDISNPVEVTLRIGDDIGNAMVRLKGKLKLEEKDEVDDDDDDDD